MKYLIFEIAILDHNKLIYMNLRSTFAKKT